MPSSIPGISRSTSHCAPRRQFRLLQLLGLMILCLMPSKPLLGQLVVVNVPVVLPATNVASSSAPQNILLKTTSAETISGLTVPVSEGNKQEYAVGAVSGCAVDGMTSNPVGTVCTVSITFSPAYPGQRLVPLQIVTSTGNINIGLNGVGVSPLTVLTPGTMSTYAGVINAPNCNAYSGPALQGPICNPSAGAVDSAGNVYVAAYYSNTVSRIDTSGNITVIAGTGAGGLSGVGGLATKATFDRPADVVLDPAGNVYFIGETAQQVFRIDAGTQILTSVAGNGNAGYSGDNGPATQASLNYPEGLAFDTQGNLYIEDHNNNLVRKVDTSGVITTVAGDPTTVGQGSPAYSGDGGPAIKAPLALAGGGVYASYDSITVDATGNLFIGDSGHHVVREVTTDGIIHTVAGNNALGGGFNGDGGLATSAQLNWPMGVAVDPAGDLYIADFSNGRIRRVDAATQTIITVAGGGTSNTFDSQPATQASLNGPQKVVLDGLGNLYVADTKNNLVRKTDVSKPVLTFPTATTAGTLDTADGPLQAIVSNIGNAALSLAVPTTGANPNISTGFTGFIGNPEPCPIEGPSSPSPGTLALGSSCQISVEFEPGGTAPGPITGTVVLTDNSLNAANPSATQTVSLVGTASAAVNTGSLTISPTTQVFADTAVGSTSTTLTSTITNTTSNAIYLSAGSLTDAVDFAQTTTCTGIIPATTGTCTVSFTFTPQSTGQPTSTYSIHDLNHPESPLTVMLSGNGSAAPGPHPVLMPATLDFGSLTVGTTSAVQTATLSNTGGVPQSISSFGFFGTNTNSFSQTNNCGPSLAVGASCSIMITCTPASAGALSANLGANFPSPEPQLSIALSCTGIAAVTPTPQAALTPTSANFGSITTGSTSTAQTFTLTNGGTASLGINSILLAGSNPSAFTMSSNNCGTSLAAGSSCTISVTFTPTTVGLVAATLTISDNAVGSPQTTALSGTGAAPAVTPDFNVVATPAFQDVVAGGRVAYIVTIAPTTGTFAQGVLLTASGLPPGATAIFSPPSITPGSSGAQSTMTLQTVVQRAAGSNGLPSWPFTTPIFAGFLLLLPGKRFRARRKGWEVFTGLAGIAVLLGIAMSITGCGGGFALPSSAQTYTITVTGTSGSDTHSATVTLTVQ